MTIAVTSWRGLATWLGLQQFGTKMKGAVSMRRIPLLLAAAGIWLGTGGTALAQEAQAQAEQVQAEQPSTCDITSRATPELNEVLARYGYGFASYDLLCARLADAGMGVSITESFGLVGDRSYGLVLIELYDRATVTYGSMNTTTVALSNDEPGHSADEALMQAIDTALESISENPERYVASVHDEIARLRIVMGGQ
jgi:hypothetical protein